MEKTLEQMQEELFNEIAQKRRRHKSRSIDAAEKYSPKACAEIAAACRKEINLYAEKITCDELIRQIEKQRKYKQKEIRLTRQQKRNAFLVAATLWTGGLYLLIQYLT